MKPEEFYVDAETLNEASLIKKHDLEQHPEHRTSIMDYESDMEVLNSAIYSQVMEWVNCEKRKEVIPEDVKRALEAPKCTIEDFIALLSPVAEPYLEEMARKAREQTSKHFGNTVYLFTPLYIANYYSNYCVYCGFNCFNQIQRKKMNTDEIEKEMKIIADAGMEEILILTGESREQSSVTYIGEACKSAKKYFRNIGLEIYPVNSCEYQFLNECGADYVTVFQETYDPIQYEKLHLAGRKRVYPYRFDSQERAILGGMRGVGLSALLGLGDYRKEALATGLHAYFLQRKYPHVEYTLSCPRLRPIINNMNINPNDVHEKQLCQILCAYRLFLPFAGITVSSRESESFRDGIVRIAATKVSAGVSTGIGDHEEKYKKDGENKIPEGKEISYHEDTAQGDEQFQIADVRSLHSMYRDLEAQGLQPVLNEYIDV